MKKYLLIPLILVLGGMVSATPIIEVPLIGGGGPIYTESDFQPLIFRNTYGGRVLIDDPLGLFANGDITLRTNNYAFSGEQIIWKVLIWDKNGVPEKIKDVFAGWVAQTNGPIDPEMQVNCEYISELENGANLEHAGYPNVRRPIDQEPQETFNSDTMGEYVCKLTIEPNCHGQKWLGIKVIDLTDLSSTMQEAESWFCNPEVDLTVSGDGTFGELGPGQQGATTFSVENSAEEGSGTLISLSIAGKDFFDPESSGALCPNTNKLDLQGVEAPSDTIFDTGFWYSAVMGSKSTNQVAPNPNGYKRIPYGNSIQDSDPLFSNSNSAGEWRKFQPNQLTPMSPGSEATIVLRLGIPQPCNGEFSSGTISLFAVAL